ncbi:mechanosensitive ion channel family protein [Halorubrum sp. Atlit-8R]|uniref:mechanosensitive ion channel family protein n=1 Tax=unclassified Halorubrum TaxID=2642239 RepID=UPI000EF27BF4|nr:MULTISPECIES: mechanosensitive ion channel family protein [unclassified Halorubrum]RLM66909.1 mechanosensitive ion channel family protein [Halorubrum sp. Atlit-9R]RLM81732.1 mechanosensitive ion channel family protein [Halorubrum sp. Atlit-8R]
MTGLTALPRWATELVSAYDRVLSELFWFLAALAVVYALGQVVVVPFVVRVVRARNRNNPTIETAVRTYVRVALIGFATLTGVIAAGYGSVLTDSAIVIAAITFVFGIAGQQVFGSLISGIFLVADPDFNVGDWIAWPGGEGTVEAVDFRVTRVRTPDNETISVPNTELTSNALTRPYGRDTYRITEAVYVAYDEDVERALMALRSVATDTEAVLDEPAPNARVLDLGENAVTVQAELWVDDPGDRDVATLRSDFRREVKRRFDEEGIAIAPPSAQSLSGELAVTERPADG